MNFKKILIFLVLSSLIFACGEDGSDKDEIPQYKISGNIIGAKSHEISLMKYEKGELVNIETSKIIGNKFDFLAGNVEAPEYYYLRIGKDEALIDFFIENSNIQVNINLKNTPSIEIKGSETQDEYSSFLENNFAFESKQASLFKQLNIAKENNDTLLLSNLDSTYRAIYKEQISYIKQFVKGNPKSYVATFIASRSLANNISEKELESLKNNFDSTVYNSIYFHEIKNRISIINKLKIGKQAPNFSLNDTLNREISLSSLQGKKVFLYFWMSNSDNSVNFALNLKKIYKKYKSENFEILAVSLDDDLQSWKNSINENKFRWLNVSDLKSTNSEIIQLYNIKKVPYSFLLNEKGIILAKNISAQSLEQFLNQK